MYVELHARSAFSFLEGSTLPEDLLSVCAARGMSAMALLDRDGLYGSPRFHLAAKKIDLKAHIGVEVSCESLHKHFSPQRHPSTSLRAGSDTEKTWGREKSELTEDAHPSSKNYPSSPKTCHPERSEGPA